MIRFLEHVLHQHIDEFPLAICFLEFARRTVANGRVPKQWVRPFFHVLVERFHLLNQVHPQALLLLLIELELGEIDAKVELFQLMFPSHLDPI